MIAADNKQSDRSPDRVLWAAVIEKAILDLALAPKLKHKCGFDDNQKHRESAYDFLFSPLPAFREWRAQVFQMAGLDPNITLDGIKPETRGIQCRKRKH